LRGWRRGGATALLLGLSLAAPVTVGGGEGFDPGRLSFSVKRDGWVSPYRVLALFVSPGAEVDLEVEAAPEAGPFRVVAEGGRVVPVSASRWLWRAPQKPGLHPLHVSRVSTSEVMTLNAFVLVPLEGMKGEHLNGYRIGRYPTTPLKGLRIYEAPAGLAEVTGENLDTPVSPHFRLGQFLCKQSGGYPKYLVLREALLLKLERLLEEVNERGHRCDTLHVMSGFRTP